MARRILEADDNLNRQKTELERAGESLRELNTNLVMASKRFEGLFNGLPVACFTFDAAGLIHEWNQAAEQIYGWPASEAIGRPIRDLLKV